MKWFVMSFFCCALVTAWSPTSWTQKTRYQIPDYPDKKQEEYVTSRLSSFAPLIFAGEADQLKYKLAEVAIGRRFLITGGDCAESFDNFSADKVKEDLRLLMQMSLICGHGGRMPTVQIGRMAGQFAKPRSQAFEVIDGKQYPVYRGDIINDVDPGNRVPDPQRMLQAYHQSAQTLNLVRAFIQGGYTTIDRIKDWKYETCSHLLSYQDSLQRIEDALAFYKIFSTEKNPRLDSFYTGHECLLLPYESSLTRIDTVSGNQYDCSAHFLWLGERTRKTDSAQTEFLSGIRNPIGIKVSTDWDETEMRVLLDKLDPHKELGKITIITRMGHEKIEDSLPRLVQFVESQDRKVVWCCDPMHGNTFEMDGRKTRRFDHIKAELDSFFNIHYSMGTIPGGIHLEMTNQNVTECIGGNIDEVTRKSLPTCYESKCDPRLNGLQALEISLMVGEKLRLREKKNGLGTGTNAG